MKEVIVRFLSSVLYVSLIFFTLLAFDAPLAFILLLFILATLTLNEFLQLVKLKGYIAYLLLAISFYFISYQGVSNSIIIPLLGITLLVNLFLFKDVILQNKLSFFKKRRYFCILFYIISGFLFLSLIPSTGEEFEPKTILGVFILAWSNDTFAYLIGKRFGKHKLLEKVSPKKTIEGFLGGMIGALVISFFIFKYTSLFSLTIWLFLAIIISVLGTTGDLIQSKFKRLAGVKDSGKIMPGHGGVYDRLDSIIYASPFIYLFLIIVNYVS